MRNDVILVRVQILHGLPCRILRKKILVSLHPMPTPRKVFLPGPLCIAGAEMLSLLGRRVVDYAMMILVYMFLTLVFALRPGTRVAPQPQPKVREKGSTVSCSSSVMPTTLCVCKKRIEE